MERDLIEPRPIQHELDFLIVSPRLTLEAMRDTGYKDTDHALAELIDNSVEAGADLVEILAVEMPPDPNQRYSRSRVNKIAVADNGEGMDHTTLRRALKFGDGTRMDRRKQGIGRFGVGLPQSSISQCKRVEIWTWQNGPDNALYCYLDLDEIKTSGQIEVPEPERSAVPDKWRTVAENTAEPTGTLVVWSKLDRIRWSGGAKTLERTADLCGRVYRKFLTGPENQITIDLKLVSDENNHLAMGQEQTCLPNDPLYLITPSSTPEPFQDRPMFELFNERRWSFLVDSIEGHVHVRCTMARPDSINEKRSEIPWPRSYSKAGDAPWGKHADRNKGVSIVRAKRELELSIAWVNNYEPEERWWSVEVEFDPILDEIFGVVNNKQHAHTFVSGAGFNWEEWKEPNETLSTFRDRLAETSDPRAHLLDVWDWINDQIGRMRHERREIMKGTGPKSRHPQTGEEMEDVATRVINEQAMRGETGQSDSAPRASEDDKIEQIVVSAKQVRVGDETAREWAKETVHNGRRVLSKAVSLGHQDAFFDVESVNDVIEVWLNEQHPVYEHLIEVVGSEIDEQMPRDELATYLRKAEFTLKLLIVAWARYEDKAPLGIKSTLEDVRMDWGREARKFLSVIES